MEKDVFFSKCLLFCPVLYSSFHSELFYFLAPISLYLNAEMLKMGCCDLVPHMTQFQRRKTADKQKNYR